MLANGLGPYAHQHIKLAYALTTVLDPSRMNQAHKKSHNTVALSSILAFLSQRPAPSAALIKKPLGHDGRGGHQYRKQVRLTDHVNTAMCADGNAFWLRHRQCKPIAGIGVNAARLQQRAV